MFNDKQVNIKARLHKIYSVELYSCNFVGNFPIVPADFLKDGGMDKFYRFTFHIGKRNLCYGIGCI